MTPKAPYIPAGFQEALGHKKLLVICETRDGRVVTASLDLVSEARSMVELFPTFDDVDAMVFEKMKETGDTLGSCGAGTVYHSPTDSPFLSPYLAARTLAPFILALTPALILCAHTPWGSEFAPRLSVEVDAPLISQCVGVTRVSDTGVSAIQSTQNGLLHCECSVEREGPIIVSWDTDSLGRHRTREGASALVVEVPAATLPGLDWVASVRIIEGDPDSIPLGEADRILAIGRGMTHEDLPVLQELAGKIKASIGGTRPVIDSGSLPLERQIGQTGLTVAPSLLLAWGISGAQEFTVGIEDAETIICVNKDAQARMFMLSDLGLVGDGKDVLRRVMELLADRETHLLGEDTL
jgi:electron transfer flavoprotein alpha subunit